MLAIRLIIDDEETIMQTAQNVASGSRALTGHKGLAVQR